MNPCTKPLPQRLGTRFTFSAEYLIVHVALGERSFPLRNAEGLHSAVTAADREFRTSRRLNICSTNVQHALLGIVTRPKDLSPRLFASFFNVDTLFLKVYYIVHRYIV